MKINQISNFKTNFSADMPKCECESKCKNCKCESKDETITYDLTMPSTSYQRYDIENGLKQDLLSTDLNGKLVKKLSRLYDNQNVRMVVYTNSITHLFKTNNDDYLKPIDFLPENDEKDFGYERKLKNNAISTVYSIRDKELFETLEDKKEKTLTIINYNDDKDIASISFILFDNDGKIADIEDLNLDKIAKDGE